MINTKINYNPPTFAVPLYYCFYLPYILLLSDYAYSQKTCLNLIRELQLDLFLLCTLTSAHLKFPAIEGRVCLLAKEHSKSCLKLNWKASY